MANASGYVKRFKSLSLLILGATLLTYEVADSGRRLTADFTEAERFFLIASLYHAEAPGNGSIVRVHGQPAADWLQSIDRQLPDMGRLINIINSWNMSDLRIEGRFSLSNGETVTFTRLPREQRANAGHSAGAPATGAAAQCPSGRNPNCHLYSLQPVGESATYEALLVYDVDRQEAAVSRKKTWQYLDPDTGGLITIGELESRVVEKASPWIGSPRNAEAAYLSLREMLQQRTVRIPIVNLDVKASRAAVFLSLFALIIAALMAHSLLAIGSSEVQSINEPWIIQIPGPRSTRWASHLQAVLSLGGALVIAILVWCPVIIIGLSISITPDRLLAAIQWLLLAAASVNALASTVKLASILAAIHGSKSEEA